MTLDESPTLKLLDCVASSNLIVTSEPFTFVTVPLTREPPNPPAEFPPPELRREEKFELKLVWEDVFVLWLPYQTPTTNNQTASAIEAKIFVYLLVSLWELFAKISFKSS